MAQWVKVEFYAYAPDVDAVARLHPLKLCADLAGAVDAEYVSDVTATAGEPPNAGVEVIHVTRGRMTDLYPPPDPLFNEAL